MYRDGRDPEEIDGIKIRTKGTYVTRKPSIIIIFMIILCIGWKDKVEDSATIFAKAKEEEDKARELKEFNIRNNNFAFGKIYLIFNVVICIFMY